MLIVYINAESNPIIFAITIEQTNWDIVRKISLILNMSYLILTAHTSVKVWISSFGIKSIRFKIQKVQFFITTEWTISECLFYSFSEHFLLFSSTNKNLINITHVLLNSMRIFIPVISLISYSKRYHCQ